MGLPLIDALALRTPVVAAEAAFIPEVSGGAALLCPVRDPAALVAAIGRVLRDEGLAQTWSPWQGHASGFSWQATAAALADVYMQIHAATR